MIVQRQQSTRRRFTVEEYLALEESSQDKHEYHDGVIVLLRGEGHDLARLMGVSVENVQTPQAMAGASRAHSLIVGNTFAALHRALRGGPCHVYMSDQRVKIRTGRYVYPDVVVACAPEDRDQEDALSNPLLIVEVLSPSIAAYDLGAKFGHYRALPSLRALLFIDQEVAHVMSYQPQGDGTWLLHPLMGLEAALELPALGCRLALADLYEGVALPDESA